MSGRAIHLVTTRYNVGLYSRPEERRGIQGHPDRWMEERYRLFSAITLPSLKAQTCQEFSWFVFVDPLTPARFIDQLTELAAGYPPLEIEPAELPIVDFLKRAIADSGAQLAITSRIDNDDGWHMNYVRSIQRGGYRVGTVVDYQDSYWFDVDSHAVYHCRTRWWTGSGWWRRWRTFFTPMISNSPSVVEAADEARTVLAVHHRQLHRLYGRRRVVMIRNRPYRLVTCHRHNLINRIGGGEGRFTRASLDVLAEFGVAADLDLGPQIL